MVTSEHVVNPQVQSAYQKDLIDRYQRLEKAADKTVQSFATLINELSKFKQAGAGTEYNDQVTKFVSGLNNTSVFFTKGLSDQLRSIHGMINPEALIEAEGTETQV